MASMEQPLYFSEYRANTVCIRRGWFYLLLAFAALGAMTFFFLLFGG